MNGRKKLLFQQFFHLLMHSDGSEESTTLCIEASNSWVFMHLELESGELFSLILIVRED